MAPGFWSWPLNKKIEVILTAFLFVAVASFMASGFLDGAGSVAEVRFWNTDDANILSYYGSLYKRLVLAPVDYICYPFFFYYLSGLTVIPAAVFLGPTPQAVALGWRLMNFLSFLGTLGLILYFSSHYLKKAWVGFLACLIFSTTYINLIFLFGFRPMTVEAFVNLATLAMTVELFQRYSSKKLVFLAVLAGINFSTKYHAATVFPLFYLVVLTSAWRGAANHVPAKKAAQGGMILSGAGAILAGFAWQALRHVQLQAPHYLERFKDVGLARQILSGYVITHLVNSFLILFILTALVFVVHALIDHKIRTKSEAEDSLESAWTKIARGHYAFFQFCGVFAVVVAITNPYLFVYPYQTLEVFFSIYQIVHDGTGWSNVGFGNPWEWFSVLSWPYVLGGTGLALLIYAFLFEIVARKERETLHVRMILMAHIVFFMAYLMFSVGLKKEHYVGPIFIDMALLIGFSLVASVGLLERRSIQILAGGVAVVMINLMLIERGRVVWPLMHWLTKKESDHCVQWAKWMDARYPPETTYLCDCRSITYLMQMDLQAGAYRYDAMGLKEVMGRKGMPEVIVLIIKKNEALVDELKGKYRLVRAENYLGHHVTEVEMLRVLERVDYVPPRDHYLQNRDALL